jgi:hypothetical protein
METLYFDTQCALGNRPNLDSEPDSIPFVIMVEIRAAWMDTLRSLRDYD